MGQITLFWVFSLASTTCCLIALLYPSWSIAYWPAVTNLAFALGYVSSIVQYGVSQALKGPAGFRWSAIFFSPTLILIWTWWGFRQYVLLRNFLPYGLVYKNYYVGRYPVDPLPKDVDAIVDLTAEFPRSADSNQAYFCVPSLDVTLPEPKDLLRTVYAVMRHQSRYVYVHCANGHGRSALFVALIMLIEGDVKSPIEAKENMRRNRPNIAWQPAQEEVMMRAYALHESSGTLLISKTAEGHVEELSLEGNYAQKGD